MIYFGQNEKGEKLMSFNTKDEIVNGINILIAISFSSVFLMAVTGGIENLLNYSIYVFGPNILAWIFAYTAKSRVVTGVVTGYFLYFLFVFSQSHRFDFSDIMYSVNSLVLIFLFLACVKYHTIPTNTIEE